MTIAGSDSGGGAGIQADLKTFAAHGVYGTAAITALTAQNTVGVAGVWPVPAEFITLQIETIAGDLGCDAVKTGMLGDAVVVGAGPAEPRRRSRDGGQERRPAAFA
jgi:hydroxymethylpyrimidine/phosphomethylpyrimidine kinase